MTYGNYPDLKKIKRILAVKLRHHGDVLLTSPLFSQLKRALPHAEISALIYSETLPMLEGHPALSHFLLYDRAWKREPFLKRMAHELSLLKAIRHGRYDLVINLTEGDRGAIAALVSGASCRVGLRPHPLCYTHLVKVSPHPRHMVERQLDALRRIGIFPKEEERELVLHIPEEAKRKVRTLLPHPIEKSILIHPVSRWRFKCLSSSQMASLLEQLHARGFPLVLSAGPAPEERTMVEEILQHVPHLPVTNLAGKLSLKELCALIAQVRALICVDSVPLHIASATKTPLVALFGPTSEQLWGPWRHPKARVVAQALSCRPCCQDGCGGGKVADCLFSMPTERIVDAFQEVLN